MQKVIQMSQRQISENGEEKSMSLQEVFLVNHSLSQAKEKERMITVTSGLICSGPYMRSGPIGSLVRTLLASSRWYSPARRLKWEVSPLYSERVSLYLKDGSNMLLKPFAVILNVKDIPSNRLLFQLVLSERRTEETASSLLPTVQTQGLKVCNRNGKTTFYPVELLPTPTAIDGGTGRINKSLSPNAKERPTLALSAKMGLLPTPNAREADKYSKKYNPNSQMGTALTAMAMNGMLPTPTARSYKNGSKPEDGRTKWKIEQGLTMELNDLAACGMLPTPTTNDYKGASTLEALEKRRRNPATNSLADRFSQTGKTSQLNPLFVAEMMGFPPNWTVLPFQSGGRNR